MPFLTEEEMMMGTDQGDTDRQDRPSTPEAGSRGQIILHTPAEVFSVLDALKSKLEEKAYSAKEIFAVRLATEEALVNAIKHGNRNDPSRRVWIRHEITAHRVWLEVEDEGLGFDLTQVPDPLAPENLERTSGRGLLLMRNFMTAVGFNEVGNRVWMYKDRAQEDE
jgi:serine/threonine-protein kinase RsbW